MAKILLLEDEDYTRKFLKKLIEQSELVEWVFDAASGREALDLFALHKPDIAIMDIELGADQELNGIEVARQIYSLAPQTYFVFLTGYSRYAIDSFCVHPYDYILKPVKQNRVREVIDILAAKVQMRLNDEKIVIKLKKETLLLHAAFSNEDRQLSLCCYSQETLFSLRSGNVILYYTPNSGFMN